MTRMRKTKPPPPMPAYAPTDRPLGAAVGRVGVVGFGVVVGGGGVGGVGLTGLTGLTVVVGVVGFGGGVGGVGGAGGVGGVGGAGLPAQWGDFAQKAPPPALPVRASHIPGHIFPNH